MPVLSISFAIIGVFSHRYLVGNRGTSEKLKPGICLSFDPPSQKDIFHLLIEEFTPIKRRIGELT